MGQAKLRRDAKERGEPWAEDRHNCPRCGSKHTAVSPLEATDLSHVPTLFGVCAECRTLWEAYPADWKTDVVEAAPCDNCAFRAGSPEISDHREWKSMLAKLRVGGSEFYCHKGCPINIDFETGVTSFDEAWIKAKGRSCAGFLRVMQTWPDWLKNRFSGVRHVLTYKNAEDAG